MSDTGIIKALYETLMFLSCWRVSWLLVCEKTLKYIKIKTNTKLIFFIFKRAPIQGFKLPIKNFALLKKGLDTIIKKK